MSQTDRETVLSVTQLNSLIRETLGSVFRWVWVAGEISDISRPRSGHVYLTLKDADSQMRAVIWRSTANRLPFDLEDGQQVICGGQVDVYPPRGTYQLVIRAVEPQGVGALQLAFKQLHQRLAAEGLFAGEHKKSLPRFPRRVAVVTSPTGAAIRDFLEVLRRRWRGVHVLIIPARVQGDGAAGEIVRGIRTANRLQPAPDVLVVTRGGGSLEDLWAFNEEAVVRAIYASQIPVVSAVGHEIDVTLSDLVADERALTPSEAAERLLPAAEDVQATLRSLHHRLTAALRHRAAALRERLDRLAQRRVLTSPRDRLDELARRVDELQFRIDRAAQQRVRQTRQQLGSAASHLESLSPLRVLARGYSVTLRLPDQQLLRRADQVDVGQQILTRLAQGQLVSRVERKDEDEEHGQS